MIGPAERILVEYAALAKRNNPWYGNSPVAGEATHSSWTLPGGPVLFEKARGVHKWDITGRRYIDLWMGHGSLMLGNAHPAVVDAVTHQMERGQHVGGAHLLHGRWAEVVRELVPSCERLRFTSSGSEATLLAMRLARSWTGQSRVIRIDGHFHGWHDEALAHVVPPGAGLNPGTSEYITVVSDLDVDAIEDEVREGGVAAVILEPGGGSAGSLPWSCDYLLALRRICDAWDVVLIFDEIISGFRYAPGGVQELACVKPDLTVLSKIGAGGMPGGIVGGRAEVMAALGCLVKRGDHMVGVPHTGTFNGFPLSAAAALATLSLVGSGDVQERAEAATVLLVERINTAARNQGLDVRAFNQSSIFHLLVGAVEQNLPIAPGPAAFLLPRAKKRMYTLLRCALLLEGVDCHSSHGWLSAVHSEEDVDEAVAGFERAFCRLVNVDEFHVSEVTRKTTTESCRPPLVESSITGLQQKVGSAAHFAGLNTVGDSK